MKNNPSQNFKEDKPVRVSVTSFCDKYFRRPIDIDTIKKLKLTKEDAIYFDNIGFINPLRENIKPNYIGSVVDAITRFYIQPNPYLAPYECLEFIKEGLDLLSAFFMKFPEGNKFWDSKIHKYEWWHQELLYGKEEYQNLISDLILNGMTDNNISRIILMMPFNYLFRAGFKACVRAFNEIETPNSYTIKNIRNMSSRTSKYLLTLPNITAGVYFSKKAFEGTDKDCPKHIKTADTDFQAQDIMIEMKCYRNIEFWAKDIWQLIIYYLLSQRSNYDFKTIKVINPRHGLYFDIPVNIIPQDMLNAIKQEW